MATAVTQLVDEMLDAAARAHPGVEYEIMLAQETSLLLEREAERLQRTVNGRLGYYAGDVYRDTLVNGFKGMREHSIIVAPVNDDDATSYYGDLRTGTFTDRYSSHVEP